MIDRRMMMVGSTLVMGSAAMASGNSVQSSAPATAKARQLIAVLAELRFSGGTSDRAAKALAELQDATRSEPGCLRYVVARDLTDEGVFHLAELWQDIGALAAHFSTPHMAAFSATARGLGYSAPLIKQIAVASIADLNPRELKLVAATPMEKNR